MQDSAAVQATLEEHKSQVQLMQKEADDLQKELDTKNDMIGVNEDIFASNTRDFAKRKEGVSFAKP